MSEGIAESVVRRWRAQDIAKRINVPQSTVIRTLIPAMVTAGVLVRRGRYWFGRACDIDTWLLSAALAEGELELGA